MRILVADDERDLAQALEAMLKREHYSVDVVYDGQDALDYGLAENYDCLVLDIMMPRRDGLEVDHRVYTVEAARDQILRKAAERGLVK